MDNKSLNEFMLKRAKDNQKKFYYKRSGKCDPAKCGGACCRYIVSQICNGDGEYHEKVTKFISNPIKTFKLKNSTHIVSPFHCPNIKIDGNVSSMDLNNNPWYAMLFLLALLMQFSIT